MDKFNITGVVLAGGTNSRFGGKIKANETIGGKRIILTILDVIRPLFSEIIIVTNTPGEFSNINDCIITGDHFLKRGPLGGIHAAMKAASNDAIFVFAGDMPFLNGSLIISQAENFLSDPADAVIPEINGNIEPLHSVFRTSLLTKLEAFLRQGNDNMIRSFLNMVSVMFFKVADNEANIRSFTNINTPADLLGITLPDSSAFTRKKGKQMIFTGTTAGQTGVHFKYPPERENLLAILHDLQDKNPGQYLSEKDMKSVAGYLNIPMSSVYGVATYYSMFSLKPRGKYILRVCSSPVCEMTGAVGILRELGNKLGIAEGETTKDCLFTLETCECLGHCEESPGVMVNNRFYGNLDRDKIETLLDSLKTEAE